MNGTHLNYKQKDIITDHDRKLSGSLYSPQFILHVLNIKVPLPLPIFRLEKRGGRGGGLVFSRGLIPHQFPATNDNGSDVQF